MTTINEQEVLAQIRQMECLSLPDPHDEREVMHADLFRSVAGLLTALLEENKKLREPAGVEQPLSDLITSLKFKRDCPMCGYVFHDNDCESAAAQLASVIAERNTHKADAENYKQKLADTLALLNEAMDQRDAYKKDAELLDWICHQDFDELSFTYFQDQPNDGMYGVSVGAGWSVGETLREAIDAAMKKENE